MATLQSYVNLLPQVFRNRYDSSGHLLQWGNELLEELQERGFLSTTIKETGQIVDNEVWLDKPTDLLSLDEIWNPEDRAQKFRVEDVNNKFKLLDIEFDPDDTAWEEITGSTCSGYAVGSIRVALGDITAKALDDLENYLFLITAGTLAGTGIVLSGNAATTTYTTLNFMHDLDAALDGTKVTAAKLVPPDEYVMMKYHTIITAITALGDEFPIPTDCEKRLVPTWLRWKCEQQAMATSKETGYWENEKDKLIYSMQASRLNRPITPAKGRRLVGMERGVLFENKLHPDYSEF
jgi:hypothetical protein